MTTNGGNEGKAKSKEQEQIRRQMKAQRELLAMAGKVDWVEGYDPEDGDDEHLDWGVAPDPR